MVRLQLLYSRRAITKTQMIWDDSEPDLREERRRGLEQAKTLNWKTDILTNQAGEVSEIIGQILPYLQDKDKDEIRNNIWRLYYDYFNTNKIEPSLRTLSIYNIYKQQNERTKGYLFRRLPTLAGTHYTLCLVFWCLQWMCLDPFPQVAFVNDCIDKKFDEQGKSFLEFFFNPVDSKHNKLLNADFSLPHVASSAGGRRSKKKTAKRSVSKKRTAKRPASQKRKTKKSTRSPSSYRTGRR